MHNFVEAMVFLVLVMSPCVAAVTAQREPEKTVEPETARRWAFRMREAA